MAQVAALAAVAVASSLLAAPAAGAVTALAYQLPDPARLVVTLDTSNPHAAVLSGPVMTAYSSSGAYLGYAFPDGGTGTTFTFDALPEGDVYLALAPSTDHGWARVHYNGGVNSVGDATPVHVTAGATASTSFVLHPVGTITGSVTRLRDSLATDPAAEREVIVYSQEESSGAWVPLGCTECGGAVEPLPTVLTTSTGAFTVTDLLVGDYKIGFRDHVSNEAYQPPATGGESEPVTFHGGTDLASASVVTVSAGTTTSGVSAVLQPLAGPPYVAIAWGNGPITCVDDQLVGAEFGWGYDSFGGPDPDAEEQQSRDGIASVSLTQNGHPVTGDNDVFAGDLIITVVVKDGYQYDPARLTSPGTTVNGNVVTFTVTIPPYDGECGDPVIPSFSDVPPGHPFGTEIGWLAATGVTTGYTDGTFRPTAPVSRQAMAAFLYRYAGSPDFPAPATPTFSDVDATDTFNEAVEWLAWTGLTTGYGDGTFHPAEPVSRQAMAAFLYRYAGSPDFAPPATARFSDVPTWHPFYDEIEWLAAADVTTGFGNGTFRPTDSVSRQAMAAFLSRFDALPQ